MKSEIKSEIKSEKNKIKIPHTNTNNQQSHHTPEEKLK